MQADHLFLDLKKNCATLCRKVPPATFGVPLLPGIVSNIPGNQRPSALE